MLIYDKEVQYKNKDMWKILQHLPLSLDLIVTRGGCKFCLSSDNTLVQKW